MDKPDPEVRLGIRLPADLHAQLVQFAQGNGRRPRASLNATIVFLLRVALSQQQAQERREGNELGMGNSQPMLLAA